MEELAQVSWVEVIGYVASTLVFCVFYMKTELRASDPDADTDQKGAGSRQRRLRDGLVDSIHAVADREERCSLPEGRRRRGDVYRAERICPVDGCRRDDPSGNCE